MENETVWLSQKQIAELYQKSKSTICEYISHIFEEGELLPEVQLFGISEQLLSMVNFNYGEFAIIALQIELAG